MKTSQQGIEMIKRHEGCRLIAYRCPGGKLTIGYGHTGADVMPGQSISQARAEELLRGDLVHFERGVDAFGLRLTQCQFDALVSLSYNIGLAALSRSTLLRKAKANPNDTSIAGEFAKYRLSAGKVLPGLVTRRADEAKLYFSNK